MEFDYRGKHDAKLIKPPILSSHFYIHVLQFDLSDQTFNDYISFSFSSFFASLKYNSRKSLNLSVAFKLKERDYLDLLWNNRQRCTRYTRLNCQSKSRWASSVGISHDEFSERERVVSRGLTFHRGSISPSRSGEGTAIKILARLHEFLEESQENTRYFSVCGGAISIIDSDAREEEGRKVKRGKKVEALITPLSGWRDSRGNS